MKIASKHHSLSQCESHLNSFSLYVLNFVRIFSEFTGAIIGTKNSIRKRITSETNTTIKYSHGIETNVEITGKNRESIKSAYYQIVSAMRSKHTHINFVPITNDTILNNFERFKVILSIFSNVKWVVNRENNYPGGSAPRSTDRRIDRRYVHGSNRINNPAQSNVAFRSS